MPTIINRFDYMTKRVCTSVKPDVVKYVVLYRDVFSMPYVYELMRQWFNEHGYGLQPPFEFRNEIKAKPADKTVGFDQDFPEVTYIHKEHPGWGTEMWLRWRCQKVLPEYPLWGLMIDLDMHILGLNPVEVVIDGKKIKADKGEIEITAACSMMVDLDQKISKHKLLKHFYNFIFHVYYHEQGKEVEDLLKQDAADFKIALKEYFKLPTYKDYRDLSRTWLKRDQS